MMAPSPAREWQWSDEAACAACAAALATRLAACRAADAAGADVAIELHGPLGAGKTTFVRHLLRALGVRGRIKSPTYTIVEPYHVDTEADNDAGGGEGAGGTGQGASRDRDRGASRGTGGLDISHFDFYRFADARELVDAGLRETFAAPGLKLVEWPAHAAAWLPPADLRLEIEPQADESRRVRVRALTPRGVALLG
ncbi:MAG: tRNA (adenosine(37)-N6)-threonylcarbamoyltransferase complex ATPase subunit type 1 TsaE [Burkholderiales bacterium]|nr:tRNA (adenosine(37)-N6)-threonylcarbamoyltransferase complex ATPase subunit type 1 TsaE [Burkholderiales bacterium]